jgi:hypothetical protein
LSRKTWVQDPTTGKLVPKHEYNRRPENATAAVQSDIEPFLSPITGQTITSRSVLRKHHADHGVTDSRDYSREYMLDRSRRRVAEATGQTAQAKQERINLITRELDKHGR